MRGGSGVCRSPRYGGGGGRGAGGRSRDGGGETRNEAGAERKNTASIVLAAAPESGRKRVMEDLPVRNSNDGAGGKYRVGGKVQEESANKSAKWSGVETMRRNQRRRRRPRLWGGAGEVGQELTVTAW